MQTTRGLVCEMAIPPLPRDLTFPSLLHYCTLCHCKSISGLETWHLVFAAKDKAGVVYEN